MMDYPPSNRYVYWGYSYWIYAFIGILSTLFIWKFVPETKAKTLEDIDILFKKKKLERHEN